mmetsp:Transcript_39424/g.67189  ORF Transcript_39424/g.67189 Transcript_39424/m.67189 type:complete len:112 (-) Transcript_39424:17-352(-)
MRRHNFGFPKLGAKMNKMGVTPTMIDAVDFHTKMWVLQASGVQDPMYEFTSPEYVYLYNQLPIELADSRDRTINNKGVRTLFSHSITIATSIYHAFNCIMQSHMPRLCMMQ